MTVSGLIDADSGNRHVESWYCSLFGGGIENATEIQLHALRGEPPGLLLGTLFDGRSGAQLFELPADARFAPWKICLCGVD